MTKNQFNGEGFSREPLSPEELARHRNMFHKVAENWLEITPSMYQAMSEATTVIQAISIIGKAIKVGGPVLLLAAGIGAYLKSQGAL